MDMNKAFFLKKENRQPRWHKIDATGKVVGRLATEIANVLRGKNSALYTPHTDAGDYVVVVNADKAVLTGDKMTDKIYLRYSGWIGGQKSSTPAEMYIKHPDFVLTHAVKGMLPKNKLARTQIKKLKVYAGAENPHEAQLIGFAKAA